MWVKRSGIVEAVNRLDEVGFAEAVELAYELVRDGCDYRRAIRIAVAQASQRAQQRGDRG